MSAHSIDPEHLLGLLGAVCDDNASSRDFIELDSIVRADKRARDLYLGHCRLHSALRLESRAHRAIQAACRQIDARPIHTGSNEFDGSAKAEAPASYSLAFPATLWRGTVGYVSSGWPLAYLVATVVLAAGAFIAHRTPHFHPVQIVHKSPPVRCRLSRESDIKSVGQITGMVGCQWTAQTTEPALGTSVFLGCEYLLASGLMEITYDTGAKIVLQGPATYQVESATGGYLAVGKLTAKLEKKGNDECGMMNDELPAAQNGTEHSTLSTRHLFAVRTPTVTVTDLGTEFGVEVGKDFSGVHVFTGTVELSTRPGNGKAAKRIVLTAAGQRSARVRVDDSTTVPADVNPDGFVRVDTFRAMAGRQPQHIPIKNASFDYPKVTEKVGFRVGVFPDWTVERATDTNFGLQTISKDGRQYFFWDAPAGSLRQRFLAHRVEAAGMVYTLRFHVGTRAVGNGRCSFATHLLIEGVAAKERSLSLDINHRAVEENIGELTYTATPADVGKRVGIQFDFAVIEPFVQAMLGDVQLSVAPRAGEPSASKTDADVGRQHLPLKRGE